MSTLLIKRAYRVLMLSMATMLMASMLAPIVAVASTDLVAGDTAIVSNPDGSGAYLRTDTAVLDDTTISAELPQGSSVWVMEAPVTNDTGVWVYVAADGYGPGWVSTTLLKKVDTDAVAETDAAAAEAVADESAESKAVTSELAWLEPIDSATVVDNNNVLPVEGLAVRVSIDGPVLGYAPNGTWLDVTSAREWVGEANYVRVNFNGVGGYVDGAFVELASEVPAQTPVEEVIWVETEVVTEEVPVETEVVTEEIPVDTAVTEVVPVETEVVAAEAAVETEVATEQLPAETEVVAENVPVETEVVAEEAPVTAALVAESVPATAEIAPADESAATAAIAESDVTTEAPAESSAALAEETTAPVESTEAPTEVSAPAPIASTANTFDATTMIGSATVTGTSSGLLCRTAPDPAAPVLMTLAEGTKVLVAAEAVNGYLGIDCGGLQGFADVNYLWSGGAGDAEINAAKMNVVVSGTGNGLNCRTGAGTSFGIITTIADGTSLVTRGAASNGWTPVICAGQNGFVSTTWIEASASAPTGTTTGSTTTTGTATVNSGGDGLYCRSGAGTSYGVITVLSHGSTVSVRGANQGDWVPVTCGGQAGFAHGSFLSVSASSGTTAPAAPSAPSTGTGSVTVANTGGQGLNCRSGAGTSFSIVTTLALGQSVTTRSGSVNGWTAVICGGTNGFVSSEFVSGSAVSTPAPTPAAPVAPSGMGNGDHAQVTSSLNLRYSASLSSSIATVLQTGVVVLVTGSVTNSFYPVNYDGLTGFVHQDYVVKTSAALSERGGSGTPTTTVPSVPAPPAATTPTGSALVNYAMRYVGYPYVWATHGPASFDCSGFTYWVVQNVMGKNIGYGTWTQVSAGTPVSKANLQPGDLVFFQNTYTAGLSHVGLYIGNGQFVHAQNEDTGVVVSDLNSSYYGPRWYGAVRL